MHAEYLACCYLCLVCFFAFVIVYLGMKGFQVAYCFFIIIGCFDSIGVCEYSVVRAVYETISGLFSKFKI